MAPCDSELQVLGDGLCGGGGAPAAMARRRAWLRLAPAAMLLSGLLLAPALLAAGAGRLAAPRPGGGWRRAFGGRDNGDTATAAL